MNTPRRGRGLLRVDCECMCRCKMLGKFIYLCATIWSITRNIVLYIIMLLYRNDLQLSAHAKDIFKLEDIYSCSENKTILQALTNRRLFFALRYEFILLHALSFSERLVFKSYSRQQTTGASCTRSSQSPHHDDRERSDYNTVHNSSRRFIQWFLDVTELPFYLILSYLSC